MDISIREVEANGLTFRCREAGVGGEPVLLLHGFPETSYMWVRLMDELSDQGYHCLAPDQRGYSPGARPADVAEYGYRQLAADILGITKAAGFDRFHLVAHDWGALASWAALSVDDDDRVASFVSLSIPHYRAFAEAVYADPEEELYRGVLELLIDPSHAAEAAMSGDGGDYAPMTAVWEASAPDEVDAYLSVFRQDGALTGALNWYRASRAHRRALDDPDFSFDAATTPTLLIWGRNDPYVRQMSVDLAAPLMGGDYRVVDLDAGHWLIQEAYDTIAAEVTAHLERNALRD
jgi:pimeloyl-ACP methyl ester carboxylesterase